MAAAGDPKPKWQQAWELAQEGLSVRKISFILDVQDREVCRLLGVAEAVMARRQGPAAQPKTFADWMCEPYADPVVRRWMRRKVEAWEARRR